MRRRRETQLTYNKANGITPQTIQKKIHDVMTSVYEKDYVEIPIIQEKITYTSPKEIAKRISVLKKNMIKHAKQLEFEEAAKARDEIKHLEQLELEL